MTNSLGNSGLLTIEGGLDSASDTGAFADDGWTSNNQPVFSGTATPGASISVRVDGAVVASALALADGRWTCQSQVVLKDGLRTLSLTATLDAQSATAQDIDLQIDTAAPDPTTVLVASLVKSAGFGVDSDGRWHINDDSLNAAAPLQFAGTFGEGDELEVFLLNAQDEYVSLGMATPSDTGDAWVFDWDYIGVDDGVYTAAVRVTDLAGHVSDYLPADVDSQTLVVDTDASTLTVAPLDTVWQTGADASGVYYTTLTDLALAGTGEPEARVVATVQRADADGVAEFTLTATVDSYGDWALDLQRLFDGEYSVSLTMTDVAGNTSDPVDAESFCIDTVAAYYGGAAKTDYVFGAHQGLVLGLDSNVDLSLYPDDHVAPADGFGYADYVLAMGTLPDGLTLEDDGRLTGTPTQTGVAWIEVHSYDFAGNESTSYVQLVVTSAQTSIPAAATTYTITRLNSKGDVVRDPVHYTASEAANTVIILYSAGDVLYAGGGDDVITVGSLALDSTEALFALVDGGAGTDTVGFLYKGESLDPWPYNQPDGASGVVSQVEVLQLAGSAESPSAIALSAADVFALNSDALDVDGRALLVLNAASFLSKGHLSATLQDFVQVGSAKSFTRAGAADTTPGADADYSKFQANYVNDQGSHPLTVLVQGYYQVTANQAPTGAVRISGVPSLGQTLSASHTLADADGLGDISYQWRAGGLNIPDATSATLNIDTALDRALLSLPLSVVASYTDGNGVPESVPSASTSLVYDPAVGKTLDVMAYSWKAHTLLEGVSVAATGSGTNTSTTSHGGTTSASGATSFTAVTDTSLSLTATRAIPTAEAAATTTAVNLQDAIAILKMIVGLEVNGTGKALSPYQALAADFDGNGAVQLSDAIGVLKHVVGLTAPTPTWNFVNEIDSTVPGKANLAPGVAQTSINADLSGTSPVHVGLVGYLSGDVDGSFAGASGASALSTSYFTTLVSAHTDLLGFNSAQFGIY